MQKVAAVVGRLPKASRLSKPETVLKKERGISDRLNRAPLYYAEMHAKEV